MWCNSYILIPQIKFDVPGAGVVEVVVVVGAGAGAGTGAGAGAGAGLWFASSIGTLTLVVMPQLLGVSLDIFI